MGVIPAEDNDYGVDINFVAGCPGYIWNLGNRKSSSTGAQYTTSMKNACYFASGSSFEVIDYYLSNDEWVEYSEATAETYTKDDKTVYYVIESGTPFASVTPNYNSDVTYSSSIRGELCWLMVYGGYGGTTVSIPVQWYSKYRTEPYGTTFEITVPS